MGLIGLPRQPENEHRSSLYLSVLSACLAQSLGSAWWVDPRHGHATARPPSPGPRGVSVTKQTGVLEIGVSTVGGMM